MRIHKPGADELIGRMRQQGIRVDLQQLQRRKMAICHPAIQTPSMSWLTADTVLFMRIRISNSFLIIAVDPVASPNGYPSAAAGHRPPVRESRRSAVAAQFCGG